jgi:hypothetical protein
MNIYDMYKKGIEMGLKKHDFYPYGNPQKLTMAELKRRIENINLTRGLDKPSGGAYSGD